ncbi:MAG: family 10 glycosylhydrolase, partial [Planctomycetia bacterium]|nr:family 10 glycosylhydrolase [Planctomycetia bacterium]
GVFSMFNNKSRSLYLPKTLLFASCLFLCSAVISVETGKGTMSQDEYNKERDRLAWQHRISHNNDGCDAFYYPANKEATVQGFLERRAANLPKTGITTMTYTPQSAGFGLFTHKTKKGEFLTWSDENTKGTKNIAKDLADQGKDVLQIMIEFSHKNNLECFFSMRMNDTHDAASSEKKYHPLFPTLKKEHPEWLVGNIAERHSMKYGRWSSVNYAVPEIRDLAVSYVEEVCQNYDVDGIELDFCRHLTFFPSSAKGESASDREREYMNELMKRMREVTDREGMRRNRPILLTVRVPDDLEYAKALGLDFDYWMKEHLADIFIGSDYFHLNQWEYWSAFGKKYHVPVYAGLSESRVKKGDNRFSRWGEPAYAARAVAAWDAGVAGIHFFNEYSGKAPFLTSCASIEALKSVNKVFFQTTQHNGYRPTHYLKEGEKYRHLPILCPDTPAVFNPNEEKIYEMDFGKEPERNPKKILLCCRFNTGLKDSPLAVFVNGKILTNGIQNKKWPEWIDFPLDASQLHAGINEIGFKAKEENAILLDIAVSFEYR